MVNYRRNHIAGASYFFTVNLHNHSSQLLIKEIDLLRYCMRNTQEKNPFQIKAIIILPEHLHALWTLPESFSDYSLLWQKIKSSFTRGLLKKGYKLTKNNRGEYKIWQHRFWEHTIQDDTDFENHVNYIHYNPVKHGLVERVIDWPYSSFHRYVRQGLLSKNWGSDPVIKTDMDYGE